MHEGRQNLTRFLCADTWLLTKQGFYRMIGAARSVLCHAYSPAFSPEFGAVPPHNHPRPVKVPRSPVGGTKKQVSKKRKGGKKKAGCSVQEEEIELINQMPLNNRVLMTPAEDCIVETFDTPNGFARAGRYLPPHEPLLTCGHICLLLKPDAVITWQSHKPTPLYHARGFCTARKSRQCTTGLSFPLVPFLS